MEDTFTLYFPPTCLRDLYHDWRSDTADTADEEVERSYREICVRCGAGRLVLVLRGGRGPVCWYAPPAGLH